MYISEINLANFINNIMGMRKDTWLLSSFGHIII